MPREPLNDLAAFAAVAEARSFTAAAARLGRSPSALSHAMRGLEERLGVRLLARSTRSVAPTDAGEELLEQLGPALDQIRAGLAALQDRREAPAGVVRLTTFHWIASNLLSARLPSFLAAHPDVVVEVEVHDGFDDIVSRGFDAGIRLRESVEGDMVAVRIGAPLRTMVVATPDYWEEHGRPTHPRDLLTHRCIGYRSQSAGSTMPWDFDKGDEECRVRVQGPLQCNSSDLALAAVRASIGVGWAMFDDVASDLASGRLEAALEDWCDPYPGAFLFHPSRHQTPRPLRALIEHLRL